MASVNLKHKIISALCKYLSIDSQVFIGDVESDVRSSCTKILKSAKHGDTLLLENSELLKVFAFAERLTAETEQSSKVLTEFNEGLIVKSVVLGNGLTPSAADVVAFAAVYPFVVGTAQSDKEKLPHVLRWMDYIQSKVEFGDLFEPILLEKVPFNPPAIKIVKKVEADPTAKKPAQDGKEATSSKEGSNVAKAKEDSKGAKAKEDSKGAKAKEDSKGAKAKEDSKGAKAKEGSKEAKSTDKGAVDNPAVVDKKKASSEGTDGKDTEVSVSLLKIQVGLVRKASKHPSADSLLVEEIDIGESKQRQVVSGLAKHISPEQLTGRFVVLISNVKPSKLRDVLSEGLVLCASNQDHTVVEPLIVPEGAKIGECVTFSGHEGKPEDVLNPKKKQLEKITPYLSTDAEGIATFKGIPFMTSAGPCKSSIPLATVK